MTERILQTNAKWLLLIIGLLGIGLLSALLLAFVWGSADPVAAETPEFTHVVNSVEVIDAARPNWVINAGVPVLYPYTEAVLELDIVPKEINHADPIIEGVVDLSIFGSSQLLVHRTS